MYSGCLGNIIVVMTVNVRFSRYATQPMFTWSWPCWHPLDALGYWRPFLWSYVIWKLSIVYLQKFESNNFNFHFQSWSGMIGKGGTQVTWNTLTQSKHFFSIYFDIYLQFILNFQGLTLQMESKYTKLWQLTHPLWYLT